MAESLSSSRGSETRDGTDISKLTSDELHRFLVRISLMNESEAEELRSKLDRLSVTAASVLCHRVCP